MSREFGEYGQGFFHEKLFNCLEDLKFEAREDFHRKFIPLFRELYEIAYAISSVEACDSSIDRTVFETINRLPKIKETIKDLENTVEPYKRVAEEAVRQAVKKDRK